MSDYEPINVKDYDGVRVYARLLEVEEENQNHGQSKTPKRFHYIVESESSRYEISGVDARRKALVCGAMLSKIGEWDDVSRNNVPIRVAAAGKAYVVAFVYSVHDYNLRDVADLMEVAEQTVEQYLSDVASLRR